MPLFRRLPKRGFNNKNFRKVYTIINVGELNGFDDGAVVDLQAVLNTGLVSKEKRSNLFKILGDGKLKKKLTVKVDGISASARKKVEEAGARRHSRPARASARTARVARPYSCEYETLYRNPVHPPSLGR